VPCAAAAAAYLRDVRTIRALDADPGTKARLEAALEPIRLRVRESLADFLFFTYARVPTAALDTDGFDEDIAALCRPLDPEALAT
jgi:hypothetical protein